MKAVIKDAVTLLKPSISGLAIFTAGLGLFMAPVSLSLGLAVAALVGTGMLVGSANALNMAIEHDVDALMSRTKDRPLPAGRMKVQTAVIIGAVLGLSGTAVLALFTNMLTTGLGVLALFIYVALYTPLKRKTTFALLIGAVPGAMPPLMGWTAASNQIDEPALVIFGIMLIWQIPHFLAISLFRKEDYARAGIKIVPVVRGNQNAQWQTIAYTTVLIPLSLMLVPLGAAGPLYAGGALGLSLGFLYVCIKGRNSMDINVWSRRVFFTSLVYVPALAACLVVDKVVG